jgi:hypothetical protein
MTHLGTLPRPLLALLSVLRDVLTGIMSAPPGS